MFLIVGGDGTLGSALRHHPARPDGVAFTSRRGGPNVPGALRLDLAANPDSWQLPDRITAAVLCAAVTSIDACEKDPAGTRALNVAATAELARRIADRGGFCVFLSTNQVFDGTKPFRREDEPPCPISEYGRQKAEAETLLLAAGHAVVRLTKVFAAVPNLLKNWKAQLLSSAVIRPFDDMVFSPVGIELAAWAIWDAAVKREAGVAHLSADADLSYATVATRLAARLGGSLELIQPTTAAAAGLTAAIPRYTTLAVTRWTPPSALAVADALIEETCRG